MNNLSNIESVKFVKGRVYIFFDDSSVLICVEGEYPVYTIMPMEMFILCCNQIIENKKPCKHIVGKYLNGKDATWFFERSGRRTIYA